MRRVPLLVLLTVSIVGCGGSDDPTSPNNGGPDPAVGDPSLELVVHPGVTYSDIAVLARQSLPGHASS